MYSLMNLRGQYTAKQIVKVASVCRAEPDAEFLVGEWPGKRMTVPQWLRWFGDRLNDKINSRDPRHAKGRKTGDEYQTALRRMQMYSGNRVIVDWIDPALGGRVKAAFAGRMRDPSDY